MLTILNRLTAGFVIVALVILFFTLVFMKFGVVGSLVWAVCALIWAGVLSIWGVIHLVVYCYKVLKSS